MRNPLGAGLHQRSLPEPGSKRGDSAHRPPLSTHVEHSDVWETVLPDSDSNGFRTRVFVEQAAVHLFYPLSLLFYLHTHGLRAAQNQLFLPWRCSSKYLLLPLFEMLNYSLPWICLALYLSMGGVYPAEIISTFAVFSIRSFVVSTKYAFMAPEEYRSYLACLDPDRAKHKLQEKQLGTGWFEPRKSLLASEIVIAATTAGVDIHRERVVLSARSFERMREYIAALGAPLRSLLGAHAQARASVSEVDTVRYNRLGGGDGGPMSDLCEETLTASVGAVALAVAIRTRAESITSPPRLRKLAVLASVFQSAVIPVATRAASLGWRNLLAHVEDCQVLVDDDPAAACPVSGPGTMLFLTLSAYRGMMFATTVLFLAVGVVDYQSRFCMLREVGNLMRSVPTRDEANPEPLVNLSVPANVVAWTHIRNLLQDLGAQYRRRIQRYTGYGLLVAASLSVWIAVTAFTMPAETLAALSRPGNEQMMLFFSVFFTFVIFVPLLAMVFAGSAANDLSAFQAKTLTRYQLLFRDRSLHAVGEAKEQAQEAAALLECAVSDLRAHDAVRPIKFLSVRADTRLFYTMATAAVTFTSGIARALLQLRTKDAS